MIVVLDTNILISALLSPDGAPARVVSLWEEGRFDVGVSPALVSELERALSYSKVRRYLKNPDRTIPTFLERLQFAAITTEPTEFFNAVEGDPDDNRVLECALGAGARYIITGDRHLLVLKEFRGIYILSPAEFLTLIDLANRSDLNP